MDVKRVEEIINSKGIISVTYKNSPVWIEHVVKGSETAHVKMISSNETMNIPVEELTETAVDNNLR
jgi:small acid-soluble spore protein H (minor)